MLSPIKSHHAVGADPGVRLAGVGTLAEVDTRVHSYRREGIRRVAWRGTYAVRRITYPVGCSAVVYPFAV